MSLRVLGGEILPGGETKGHESARKLRHIFPNGIIYTRTFEDRFFFEIVERRNYDLFGAANTPVRLAAQAALADAEQTTEIEFD